MAESVDMTPERCYARAIVYGLVLNSRRKSLSADYCGQVLRWIDQVAPEVTRNRQALGMWIAFECLKHKIALID